ncbi:Hint domain-containing protein [Marimonas arenosa]|uniref:Hint domain-containing protein n=1 Tax=Marimonas arenosa TaxID=1795305 RepID=A0AAE4B5Y7_9RHOB|nr:Hint domain-containing protein [Marimonas arenosa]MDQ2089811.1 Hint domain-containing protein [Marimonas arenosa]
MAFSIFALDNEFAVATGANVNSSPGQSGFDYPPTSSTNLVITVKEGDTDPRLFEVGDIFDISFGGPGGAHVLTDAVVIRSDATPDGTGGVIVFEGRDENGDLTQVVWTSDFDLESWYFDNFVAGQPPQFYTTDQNAAYSHSFVCFAGDTRIATALGGICAADLWEGDRLETLDAGSQPVLWMRRRQVAGQGADAPVLFSPGTIGNFAPLRLSQQHRVLVRSPLAELMFGSSEVLVPAKAMVNGVDIRIDPCARIEYVHMLLPAHHLVFAEGALCESLLPGEVVQRRIDLPPALAQRPYTAARPLLTFTEAMVLLGTGPFPLPPVHRRGVRSAAAAL